MNAELPAMVAPPSNKAIRYWSMYRGYHSVMLRNIDQHVTDKLENKNDRLVNDSREQACLRNSEQDTNTDELRIPSRV